MIKKVIAFAAFVACIPLANWMIGNVGTECIPNGPCLIPVGLGLLAPSGVLVVGLALVARDAIHETAGPWAAILAVLVGAALSALFAPPALLIASSASFLLSELADFAVYSPLRRDRRELAIILSGFAGAVVDSAVFLLIAFGSLQFIEGQIVGKLWFSLIAGAIVAAKRWKAA